MKAIYLRLKSNAKLKEFVVAYSPQFIIHFVLYCFDSKTRMFSAPIQVPTWYESWLAPKIAMYFCWLLWPLYNFFKWQNFIFIINNISTSPGHMAVELDWMLRDIAYKGEVESNRYIVIWPQSEVAHGAAKEYASNTFPTYIVSTFLYIVALPFFMRFEDLVRDYGLSSQELHKIRKNHSKNYMKISQIKSSTREFSEVWLRYQAYYLLRNITSDNFPLKQNFEMDDELRDFIGIENIEKYALIQIKTSIVNGTLLPTDPSTYVPAINFLKESGCKLIFIGREKMPSIFKEQGLINYSEWCGSTFSRDLQLVAKARLGITSASGFANLFDLMRIPLVYSNQWNFLCPPPGRSTVFLPTLLGDSFTQKLWPFRKQIEFFYQERRSDFSGGVPLELIVQNVSGFELLEATKEALALENNYVEKSQLQKKFQLESGNSILSLLESRISQNFIEKYEMLFD